MLVSCWGAVPFGRQCTCDEPGLQEVNKDVFHRRSKRSSMRDEGRGGGLCGGGEPL